MGAFGLLFVDLALHNVMSTFLLHLAWLALTYACQSHFGTVHMCLLYLQQFFTR